MGVPGFYADATLQRAHHTYVTRSSSATELLKPGSWVDVAGPIAGIIGPGIGIEIDLKWYWCDTPGSPCCSRDANVKTRHCHKSLGCNIDTNECEPCGGAGQVCCDGDYTGFSLRGYSGFLLDSQERISTCNPGLRCDAALAPDGITWIGTRRCQPCGTTKNAPCCAPDTSYGLGRCYNDAASGERLVCSDPYKGAAGVCIPCGKWAGQPECIANGRPCDPGMVADQYGICRMCGFPGQPTCDDSPRCRPGAVPHKFRDECVSAGRPNEPCDPTMPHGCMYRGTFCNAVQICEPCGNPGQLCCPAFAIEPGFMTDSGCMKPGECRDTPHGRRCAGCGHTHGPVCQHERPCQGADEPVNGWCRPCGNEGQVCCFSASIKCFDGMKCQDGTCRRPGGGGGGTGEQWKTCSGQPYTWSTVARDVTVEYDDDCAAVEKFIASTDEEARQCAAAKWGADAVVATPSWFNVWLDCDNGDCKSQWFWARSFSKAKDCAEAQSPSCEVRTTPCP